MSTLKLRFGPFATILRVILFIFLYVGLAECLLRFDGIVNLLPPPSVSSDPSYAELDYKLRILEKEQKLHPFNCFLLGSSMVDSDLDPVLLSEHFSTNGNPVNCFNFGLSGSMTEVTYSLARYLVDRYHPEILVFGTSPLEFDPNYTKTRPISRFPIFRYHTGQKDPAGFFYEYGRTPWYYNTLLEQFSPAYQKDMMEWVTTLSRRGFRLTDTHQEVEGQKFGIRLKNFVLNPADVTALQSMMGFREEGITVYFVEMPVHPYYRQYLLDGGVETYRVKFLKPVQTILTSGGYTLITTQDTIDTWVEDSHWYNSTHLNRSGAEIYTRKLLPLLPDGEK